MTEKSETKGRPKGRRIVKTKERRIVETSEDISDVLSQCPKVGDSSGPVNIDNPQSMIHAAMVMAVKRQVSVYIEDTSIPKGKAITTKFVEQ